eukprot:354718-Chlamydomonas_euryale.AAC.6
MGSADAVHSMGCGSAALMDDGVLWTPPHRDPVGCSMLAQCLAKGSERRFQGPANVLAHAGRIHVCTCYASNVLNS